MQLNPLSDRHYQIRDLVAKYFKIGQKIGLYDYDDDSSFLTWMEVRKFVNDFALEEGSDDNMNNADVDQNFWQYVLAFEIDFTRKVTEP